MSLFNLDFAHKYQVFFQDSAAPQMDGIIYLHNYIMSLEVGILIFVCYIAFLTIYNFYVSYKTDNVVASNTSSLYFIPSNKDEFVASLSGSKVSSDSSRLQVLSSQACTNVVSLLTSANDTFTLSSDKPHGLVKDFPAAASLVGASLQSGSKRPVFTNIDPLVAYSYGIDGNSMVSSGPGLLSGLFFRPDFWLFHKLWKNLGVSYFNNIYRGYQLQIARISHGSFIEVIWTIIPSVILLFIAFPSFALLYALEEAFDAFVNIKVIGHQWYWSYEYYLPFGGNTFAEDSYMVPTADLKMGELRLLEVDNPLILPIKSYVRLLITSLDVLHCWTVPSLGIKVDAVPGRLNQGFVFMKRAGIFYGQCSELCGTGHGFMPIAVHGIPLSLWLELVDQINAD